MENNKLPGDYIAGFVDGEGCFAFLKCGRISVTKTRSVRYEVSDVRDLSERIVPFFERYSLRAKKRLDFKLWKEALRILIRNRQIKEGPERKKARGFQKIEWIPADLERLKEIHHEMGVYKSKRGPLKWLSSQ